jgi:hypothetical protein
MKPHARKLMMKLAFYALSEPRERADEPASRLLEPLPREVSERRLQALLDAHFPSDSAVSEIPTSKRTTASHRRRRWRGAIDVGSVITLAAAVLLVWLLLHPRPAPELETMPGFSVALHEVSPETMRDARSHDMRCPAPPGTTHTLVICLRPAQPIDGVLAVAAFAESERGEGHWVPLEEPGQSDQGVLMIEQPIVSLGLSPGRWRITFYVTQGSRRAHYDRGELRDLSPGAHPGVFVVEDEIKIGPGTAP